MIANRKGEQQRGEQLDLRDLIETLPALVLCALPDGSVEFANRAFHEYSGCSLPELRGGEWHSLIHSDDRLDFVDQWSANLASGTAFETQARLRRSDGQYRWFSIKKALAVSLTQNGEPSLRALIACEDISERKRAEEAQQALQVAQIELERVSRLTTMGELAASIAHEVNQPLAAIANNGNACLRLLANNNLQPEILRRALEEIVADTTRASAVIARIRALIKKTPSEKTKVNINEVIHDVMTLTGRQLQQNRVFQEYKLAPDLPLVMADRVQLQQVLLNLVMNGIEAMTGAEHNRRLLRIESGLDKRGSVVVAVRDSGSGLGSEADHLFTPFFTTKANGMGMGLSISRTIIEAHGGRLWAEPNIPAGAVFSFTLPLVDGSSS
jgi:PAS domain S-box-containing protein